MIPFELIEEYPFVDVQEEEYKRLLGYPNDREFEGRVQELATWARQWYQQHGKPWVYARQADEITIHSERVEIEGTTFQPGKLAARLKQAEASSVLLVAMSAGRECEETARKLWDEGKPDEYFFLEVYGSAVVEQLVASTSFRLCEWADQQSAAILPHYSPGYPGWDITEQAQLLNLMMRSNGLAFRQRIGVLESGMLQPKKSLLAVFGITRRVGIAPRLTEFIPCEHCSQRSCRYRRAPQKRHLPRFEDVRSL